MSQTIEVHKPIENAAATDQETGEDVRPKLKRRYIMMDREKSSLLESLRSFLSKELRLYRETTIFLKSGGRSGDLGEEILEYDVFVHGREGGCTEGTIHPYSVVDHSCNGFAHHLSVLTHMADESEVFQKLVEFLEDAEFVSSHSSFKERPFGWHCYRAYLDTIPALNLHNAFSSQDKASS